MRSRVLGDAAAAAGFALASWALYGYTVGTASNQQFYLPWVLARLRPGLFAGDPVVAAIGGAPTFFWRGVAALAAVLGLPGALAGLWLAGRLAFAFVTLAFVRRLGGGRTAGLLALALVLFSFELTISAPWAGDPMLHNFVDQTETVWPWALACFWAAWTGRRMTAGLGLGLLANLNPMIALNVCALAAVDGLMECALSRRSARPFPGLRREKELLAFAGCAAAGAAPILAWFAFHPPHPDMALMIEATPLTYLPSAWTYAHWFRAGAAWLAVSALFSVHPERRRLFRLLGAAALLWLAAGAAGSLAVLRPLASLQLLRGDVLIVWTALAAGGVALAASLRDADAGSFCAALGAAWGLVTLLGSPLTTVWAAALLANRDRRVRAALGAMALVFGTLALRPSAGVFRLLPTPALVVSILGALIAASNAVSPRRLSSAARAVLGAVPAAALLILGGDILSARSASRPPGLLHPVEAWARTTPPGASFIVPPDANGFRLHSERRVYAEWEDFNLALWDAPAAAAWKEREARLGFDWSGFAAWRLAQDRAWELSVLALGPVPAGSPTAWGPADAPRLLALAREAGAAYVVAPESAALSLPVVYDAAGLQVLRPQSAP